MTAPVRESPLVGSSAIVTGGYRGIGLEVTRQLITRGATVVVLARNSAAIAAAVKSLNEATTAGRAVGVVGDVTDEDDVCKAFDRASEVAGVPAVLVNNAGTSDLRLIKDMELSEWRRVFDVCAAGTFLMTREFARRHAADGSPGSIVNITSLNWSVVTEGIAHYCSAKAAIAQFTRAAALEFAPLNIRVNAVSPGLTRTSMGDTVGGEWMSGEMGQAFLNHIPMGRIGEPADVAKAVIYLASEQSSFVTGDTVHVDGGGHLRGLPGFWNIMAPQLDRGEPYGVTHR